MKFEEAMETVISAMRLSEMDADVRNCISEIEENMKNCPVERPTHYTQGRIEVCDFIIDQKMGFLEGNIIKYVSRYKLKNGIEDLRKAKWYLDKLIETLSSAQEK